MLTSNGEKVKNGVRGFCRDKFSENNMESSFFLYFCQNQKTKEMKFSDFKNNAELLAHFGFQVYNEKFIDFEQLTPIAIPAYLADDFDFVLANRGDTGVLCLRIFDFTFTQRSLET